MPGPGHVSIAGRFQRIASLFLLVVWLILTPAIVSAQEGDDPASTPEVIVENPDTPPDAGPTDEPTAESPPDDTAPPPSNNPGADATPPGESEAPPSTPELSYASNAPMECLPVSGNPADAISAGGTLDYDCSFEIALHGRNVDPGALVIDWTVSAATESSWTLQLAQAPVVDDSAWSPVGEHQAQLQAQQPGAPDLAPVAADDGSQETTLDGNVTLHFQMRLARPQCAGDPVEVELDRTVAVSLAGNDLATITQDGAMPEPLQFRPLQAEIVPADPVVSIAAMSIDPVAFSLSERTTQGAITLQVDTAAVACQNFVVSLAVQAFSDTNATSTTTLQTVTAADDATQQAIPALDVDAGLPLNELSPIAVMQTGAAAGSYTLTIVFSVAVPGQLGAGAFDVRASALVAPAER